MSVVVDCSPNPDPGDEVGALLAGAASGAPGPEFVAVLASLDMETLTAAQRVDYLVAVERQRSWMESLSIRVIASMDAHADLAGDPMDRAGRSWVREDVGAALRIAPMTARRRIAQAVTLVSQLADTMALMIRGEVTGWQAFLLCEAVARFDGDEELVAQVQARVLAKAAGQTYGEFAAALRKAVIAADPAKAERRHTRSLRDRHVRVSAADDGMSYLTVFHAADAVQAVMEAVTAVAAGKAPGDERTAEQRRADALIDLVAHALSGHGAVTADVNANADARTNAAAGSARADTDAGGKAHLGVSSKSIVRAGATVGANAGNIEEVHHGARSGIEADNFEGVSPQGQTVAPGVPAERHRPGCPGIFQRPQRPQRPQRHAGGVDGDVDAVNASVDFVGTDVARGEAVDSDMDSGHPDANSSTDRKDVPCLDRKDVPRRRADRDSDIGLPSSSDANANAGRDLQFGSTFDRDPGPRLDSVAGDGRDPGLDPPDPDLHDGPRADGATGPECGEGASGDARCHCVYRTVKLPLPMQQGRRPAVQVIVGFSTLRGIDDQPGYLSGYGAITAGHARRIAADPTGTWQRLVTDPFSGRLLDVGRNRYKPPQDLIDHVLARDRECIFVTCHRNGRRCDIDHTLQWGRGGHTNDDNTAPLCPRHHAAKDTQGWIYRRDPETGNYVWRSPTGHQYTAELPDVPRDTTPSSSDPLAFDGLRFSCGCGPSEAEFDAGQADNPRAGGEALGTAVSAVVAPGRPGSDFDRADADADADGAGAAGPLSSDAGPVDAAGAPGPPSSDAGPAAAAAAAAADASIAVAAVPIAAATDEQDGDAAAADVQDDASDVDVYDAPPF